MDMHDIFSKIGYGIRFDLKRFRSDAEKLEIVKKRKIKTKNAPQRKKEAIVEEIDEEEAENDSDEQLESGDDDGVDDTGSEDSGSDRKKKAKKPKQTLSKEKTMMIHQEEMNHLRNVHRINARGSDLPDPIDSFDQLESVYHFNPCIVRNVKSMGFTMPTPIQMLAIPVMIQRREMLACAPTGSGKTAAFVLPLLHHLKQPEKNGFRAVIVSPTRELAKQICSDCKQLAEGTGLRIFLMEKMSKAVKKFGPKSSKKCDLMVTTPNRLVCLLKMDPPGIDLSSVEWLVVDEADKLFEEGQRGFRDQLAAIYQACDSQKIRRALLSATHTFEVEQWCRLNLDNLVEVAIGTKNRATETIDQQLLFVGSETGKLIAIRDIIRKGFEPPALIFVQSKDRATALFKELIYDGINVDVIHADRTQQQRDNVVKAFHAGHIWMLICTDLLGRGIDFKDVNLVVNYDFPQNAISYIHRIGRTGRAGRTGKAITFFTEDDLLYLKSIANVMRNAGCPVPEYMLELKRPPRRIRKKIEHTAPDRAPIAPRPKYDIQRTKKRREMIEGSKRRKLKTTAREEGQPAEGGDKSSQ